MNNTLSHISFYVYRKDGSKNPDILRYFLEERELTAIEAAEGSLLQVDGSRWTLVLEDEVHKRLQESSDAVRCIISFQLRRSGAYAVARLWKPKPTQVKA